MGGHVISTAVSVLTAAITLRYLGPRRAGLYYEALAIVAIASSFSESGLGAVALREYSVASPDRRALVLRDVLSLRLLLLAIGASVATAWIFASGDGVLALSVAVAGVATLALVAQSTLQVPLLAESRVATATVVQVAVALAGAASVVLLVMIEAPLAPFLGVFLPGALLACFATARLVRPVAVGLSWNPGRWRRLVMENAEYSVSAVLSVIWFRSGPLLVSIGASSLETGFYGVGFRIVDGIESLGPLVLAVALPNLSRLATGPDPRTLRRRFGHLVRVMVLGGTALGVMTSLAASPMLGLLGGDSFSEGAPSLQLMAGALPLAFTLQTCGYVLLALRAHRYLLLATAASVIVVVPTTFLGARVDGARGAAAAFVASHVIVVVIYGVGVLRSLGRPKGLVLDVAALYAAGATAVLAAPMVFEKDLHRSAFGTTTFTLLAGLWLLLRNRAEITLPPRRWLS